MWAAAKGRLDTLALLIDHGADVNAVTAKGWSALFFALKSGVAEAADLLLARGANADQVAADGTSVVQMALYQQQFAVAERLVARGVDVAAFDLNGNQLLHAAAIAKQPALVRALLDQGADANALQGPSTVEWRFERNFKAAAYYVPPKRPLQLAAEAGAADVMQLLVAAGADPALRVEDGSNIVLAAAGAGSVEALQLALTWQPDSNVTNASGDTPLHVLLASAGRATTTPPTLAPMLALLAANGARSDIANARGRTATDVAVASTPTIRTLFAATFQQALP
jgi:ankyrin repeat protein